MSVVRGLPHGRRKEGLEPVPAAVRGARRASTSVCEQSVSCSPRGVGKEDICALEAGQFQLMLSKPCRACGANFFLFFSSRWPASSLDLQRMQLSISQTHFICGLLFHYRHLC